MTGAMTDRERVLEATREVLELRDRPVCLTEIAARVPDLPAPVVRDALEDLASAWRLEELVGHAGERTWRIGVPW